MARIPTAVWSFSVAALGHVGALGLMSLPSDRPATPPPLSVELAPPAPPGPTDPGPEPDRAPSPLPSSGPLPSAAPPAVPGVPSSAPSAAVEPTATRLAAAEVGEAPSASLSPGVADAPGAAEVASAVPAAPPGAGTDGASDGDPTAEPSDYRTNPAPSYPLVSRLLGEQGLVLLKVLVDTGGRPGSIGLHRSCGFQRLDDSAIRAVGRWRFHPAKRSGRNVQAWVVVPIRFSLEGA